ncbi:MAG: sn-glycerol-3-phosphate-binding periplasmic protein UgpB precursor [Tenericutes bacterium ADurb.BinA155]|nr:MAG: sn-glycerol-3-phosphate-binding periplasmic protein UgpB precursor [Tenericutes bacterium ADurb.BinA155]
MSYKNKVATSILALAGLAMIAGCGENASSAKSSATSTPASTSSSASGVLPTKELKADITFWHTIGKANLDTLNTMITEFNKVYPNINITTTSQGGYDTLKDTISNAIPAGTQPTMAYCYPDHVAEYLAAGAVTKLDSYIDSPVYGLGVDNGLGDSAKSDFIQTYWNEGNQYTVDGVAKEGVYSLPFSKSTEVMFYNKTAFDANGWTVPTTWDQMWELCAQIKSTAGFEDKNPLGYDSDANWYITLSEQKKIAYTTGVGKDHFLFNNADAKTMVTDLKAKYDLGYWKSQATLGNGTYTSTKFTAGDVLMSIGSTGGTTYNYTENFTTGVAAIPQADLNDGKVIMQGPSICFFNNATAEQKLAAWLFYKFITNTKNSAIWSVSTGYNPVRTSSFSDDVYTKRTDTTGAKGLVKTVADFLADSANHYSDWFYTSPAFKGSSVARVQMGALVGSVMLGTKDVDKAFTDAMANCLFAG